MESFRNTACRVSAILLAAGLALPALAQNETRRDQTQQNQQHRTAQPEARSTSEQIRTLSVHRASDVIGMDIRNANDDSLGNISDVVVDRGSGRITHFVVKTGDILGMGGDRVAIPFEVFSYNAADRTFALTMTSEDMDRVVETTPTDWVVLESEDDLAHLRSIDRSDSSRRGDMYASAFGAGAKAETIEGKVVRVVRGAESGNEYVTVEVQPSDESRQPVQVVLGPSWYVMGRDHAPMRDQDVTIKAVRVGTGETRYVATGYGTDGHNLDLRSDKGQPYWASDERAASVIMLSDVIGRDANARDEKGGEIQDALVEAYTGTVPVLLFDPNENVLGLGDDLHCVPWSEASIGAEVVRIDANTETLAQAPVAPDDLSSLNSPDAFGYIYQPFGADVTTFHARKHRNWDAGSRGNRAGSENRRGG